MKIRELFVSDVTRDIPPVVYFHEQSPEKLDAEVREYIVTGGFPEGSPQAQRVPRGGIHEQFVSLLTNVRRQLDLRTGASLPAAWISGFYGSGKSSFAKLVGLSLDGRTLPSGASLSEALLARDDSPRAAELREAWEALRAKVDPIAVVFDIGGVARDNEHIHNAALRKARERLGYSPNALVADFEHKLEQDGLWPKFLAAARKVLRDRDWKDALADRLVDQHFSHIMHELDPARYPDPMSWIDAHAGQRSNAGTSVEDAVKALDEMLALRAPGRTLFFVVDEVSQYVHQDDNRMLKLQSWVSELGQKLHGRVWLFATGQQKLEDQSETTVLAKLKDRFLSELRVHLDPANIRDVVHKRLLQKSDAGSRALRALFNEHRADLKLHALGGAEMSEDEFVEVYPLLPPHVDLLLRITSNLRSRSTRTQSDSYAIRGLLQLLGELFRQKKLADIDVGQLVSFDLVYDVLHSALSPDVQTSLARIMDSKVVRDLPLSARVARVVALLEQIQDEQQPTTAEFVAKCLYDRLGAGNQLAAINEALEALRVANLLGYSERTGYKIQSSAGQQWQIERDKIDVGREQIIELVRANLRQLFGISERPKHRGHAFPFSAFFTDLRYAQESQELDARTETCVAIDVRYTQSREDEDRDRWVQFSTRETHSDRILWVTSEPSELEDTLRELVRSSKMLERHRPTPNTAPEIKHLHIEESIRAEKLDREAKEALARTLLEGNVFFRGRPLRPRDYAQAFGPAMLAIANEALPLLYPHFSTISVSEKELEQLLEPALMGPSKKFFDDADGLGILAQDAGRTVVSCQGEIPKRVLKLIEDEKVVSGSRVLLYFAKPPFGHPADVLRAVLVGLLRASRVRIRMEDGAIITSVRDKGVRDLLKDRSLRKAECLLNDQQTVTPRDLVTLARFFEERFARPGLPREADAIADVVYELFPAKRRALAEFEARLARLPRKPPLPALDKLNEAFDRCQRSRQVEETVVAVKNNLDALRDGIVQLDHYRNELTDESVELLLAAQSALDGPLAQLCSGDSEAQTRLRVIEDPDAKLLLAQLEGERPWRDVASVKPVIERAWERFLSQRRALYEAQQRAIEEATDRVKLRPGFERLAPDARHRVLRLIQQAALGSAARELRPTLDEMEVRFAERLRRAEDEANNELDVVLRSLDERPVDVQRFDPRLKGREVGSLEELDQALSDLRERAKSELEKGRRLRFT